VEIAYENGIADTAVVAETNKQIAVHFTPDSYPVELQALKIYLDKGTSTGTAAQFSVFLDDGSNGTPGTRMTRVNKSGLTDGFNVLLFPNPVQITKDGFYITYKRYGNGLLVGAEQQPPVSGHTWLETSSGWEQVAGYDAILRAFVDTTVTMKVDVVSGMEEDDGHTPGTISLMGNYPNPFNPQTTIVYDVPARLNGIRLEIAVYNILGERVRTLFNAPARNGRQQIIWYGKTDSGQVLPSGVYFVRLSNANQIRTKRMLLLK